jgi:colicin import membrane protein
VPKPQPKPRVDPFQEQLKREAEQLTQRKQAESAAQELAQVKASTGCAARNKGRRRLPRRIRGKIRGNIVLPPDIKGNPEAVFEVTQLPSGEVISVKAEKILRKRALDAAVERAILKSSPLPKPEQSDVFDRLLNIPYRPRED